MKKPTRLLKALTNKTQLSNNLLLSWKERNNKSFLRTKRLVKDVDDTLMKPAQRCDDSMRRAATFGVDIGLGMG